MDANTPILTDPHLVPAEGIEALPPVPRFLIEHLQKKFSVELPTEVDSIQVYGQVRKMQGQQEVIQYLQFLSQENKR